MLDVYGAGIIVFLDFRWAYPNYFILSLSIPKLLHTIVEHTQITSYYRWTYPNYFILSLSIPKLLHTINMHECCNVIVFVFVISPNNNSYTQVTLNYIKLYVLYNPYSYMYVCTCFTLCLLYVYCIFTVCLLYVYCMCTVC